MSCLKDSPNSETSFKYGGHYLMTALRLFYLLSFFFDLFDHLVTMSRSFGVSSTLILSRVRRSPLKTLFCTNKQVEYVQMFPNCKVIIEDY